MDTALKRSAEIGIWVRDDDGNEFVVTTGMIRVLTPDFPLPDRAHHAAEKIWKSVIGDGFLDDLRRPAIEVISDLYAAMKSRL